MGCIYKITNLINNKIYIGQTRATEPQRWQSHIWHAYNDPENDSIALCNAIKKYGRENFKREIIEECNDSNELNNKEIYYIKLFNSTDKNIGYNITPGGDGYERYSTNDILSLYEELHSVAGVAKALGANKDSISKRLRGMGIDTYNTTVLQFDFDQKLIDTYHSFAQAKEKTKLNLPHIIPYHHFCCGYFWIYETDSTRIKEIIDNYINNSHLVKAVSQFDTNCNYIQSFGSAQEASNCLQINVSSIKAALLGNQLTAGGYIWHKENGISIEDRYLKYLLSSSCCEIEEIDTMGNSIKIYKSATNAEKELGWSYNSIKNVCDYKTTHTHGRIFRYTNKDKCKLLNERK